MSQPGLTSKGLTAGRIAAAAERRKRVFELRKSGKSFREIAPLVGVSHAQVANDYAQVMAELNGRTLETAEQYRTLHLARLEAMVAGLWPSAEHGNALAVDRVVKLLEREAKLLGLDAAQTVRHEWVQAYQALAEKYGVSVERVYELAGYQPGAN